MSDLFGDPRWDCLAEQVDERAAELEQGHEQAAPEHQPPDLLSLRVGRREVHEHPDNGHQQRQEDRHAA